MQYLKKKPETAVLLLLLGLVVLAIINAEHAFGDGLLVILKSGFKSPRNMGTVLANACLLYTSDAADD